MWGIIILLALHIKEMNALKLCATRSSLNNQRFAFNRITTRKFGITDTIINFATNTVEQTKEKQFATMVESMVSLKDFTMRSYKESLDKQLTSWMMYVPGVSKQADTNQLKQFQGMLLLMMLMMIIMMVVISSS